MQKRKVASNISFADSEFRTLELTDNDILLVYLTSWDNKTIKMIGDVPAICDSMIGDV